MSEYTTVVGIVKDEDRIEDTRSLFDLLSTPRRRLHSDPKTKTIASRMGKDRTERRDQFAQLFHEPYLVEHTTVFEPIKYKRLFVFRYETTGGSYRVYTRTEDDPFTNIKKSDKVEYEWTELPKLYPRDYNHHPNHRKLIKNITTEVFNFSIYP
jgi:hypothetical protein